MTSSHPTPRPVPVVLPTRRRPRPPLRTQARPAVPRRRPGPRPAGPSPAGSGPPSSATSSGPAITAVAAAGKRAETHRRVPRADGGPAAAERGRAADPRPGRHPDQAVRAARPGGRRPPQPDPRTGRLAVRLRPRLRRPRAARHPPGVGRRSPCRCWPGCTSARRTCPASTRSTGRRSGPSWNWPSSCCGGPSPGWGCLGKPIWVVADGAYAKADFLKPAKALGMTVVSRLRKDAALWTLPGPRPRGPAGPAAGSTAPTGSTWPSGPASGAAGRPRRSPCTGSGAVKRYKTFLATWRPAGGRDPGGAGGRADRLAGVLLHRHRGERSPTS